MTVEIALLLIIIAIALVLFSTEWLPIDVIAIGLLLALVLTGLLPPEEIFAGFGSESVVLILGLLIMTAALMRTGVVDLTSRFINRRMTTNPDRLLLVIMLAGAGLSSLMSNTATTAFFIPIVMGISRRLRISASRLLMPLAFATILASAVTLVGTSTNIVVSGMMTQYGMPPLGMFELTIVGIPIAVLGIAYMYFIGRRLVPDRSTPDALTEEFDLQPFLTEVVILPNSPLIGKTLAQAALGRDLGLTVIRIEREGTEFLAPRPDTQLAINDTLLLEGPRDEILRLKKTARVGIAEDTDLSDGDLQVENLRLAEVILLPRSSLIGRSLIGVRLREQFGIQVLAINRHEATLHHNIGHVPLRMGDVLLVQGPQTQLANLERNNTFRIMGTIKDTTPDSKRAPVAMAIFAGVLLVASVNLVTLPVAMLTGALLVFLTRCITPEEAYREVEWKLVILIACMLAFGRAMEYTGTAQYLADGIVSLAGHANPVWLLGGFFLLTVALTQPMSNQSAAAVVLPVAIQSAVTLGLNPRLFAITIALAASISFITPLEPACLMVYGLGRYRFADFLKVGSLLTLLIFLLIMWMVPRVWSLY